MNDKHEHHHGHDHAHHHGIGAAFWLAAIFAIVELVGGIMSHSLALLADAGHMILDVAALGLAMWAGRVAKRPAHAGMSYGYGRAKVLAAQVNAWMLCLLAVWIVWEAISRLKNPPEVQGEMVLWIATIGLLVNLIMMKWMHGSHDLNTRAAYWHVVGDALGSVAAMIAGIVILTTGWVLIDPILSFVIAAILLWGGWRLIHETSLELMSASPEGMDIEHLKVAMKDVDGVVDMHHIHLWRLPSNQLAISAHIRLDEMGAWVGILPKLISVLKQYGIEHVTLQAEIDCYDS